MDGFVRSVKELPLERVTDAACEHVVKLYMEWVGQTDMIEGLLMHRSWRVGGPALEPTLAHSALARRVWGQCRAGAAGDGRGAQQLSQRRVAGAGGKWAHASDGIESFGCGDGRGLHESCMCEVKVDLRFRRMRL